MYTLKNNSKEINDFLQVAHNLSKLLFPDHNNFIEMVKDFDERMSLLTGKTYKSSFGFKELDTKLELKFDRGTIDLDLDKSFHIKTEDFYMIKPLITVTVDYTDYSVNLECNSEIPGSYAIICSLDKGYKEVLTPYLMRFSTLEDAHYFLDSIYDDLGVVDIITGIDNFKFKFKDTTILNEAMLNDLKELSDLFLTCHLDKEKWDNLSSEVRKIYRRENIFDTWMYIESTPTVKGEFRFTGFNDYKVSYKKPDNHIVAIPLVALSSSVDGTLFNIDICYDVSCDIYYLDYRASGVGCSSIQRLWNTVGYKMFKNLSSSFDNPLSSSKILLGYSKEEAKINILRGNIC